MYSSVTHIFLGFAAFLLRTDTVYSGTPSYTVTCMLPAGSNAEVDSPESSSVHRMGFL